MNILVNNLSVMTTTAQLSNLFIAFGKVLSVKISRNAYTGLSLGFGFIEMESRTGVTAIKELHNRNFMNHYIEVSETRL